MTRTAWLVLGLLALCCVPASASGTNAYQKMVSTISGAKTYKASIDLTIDVEPASGQGGGTKIHSSMSVAMKQPNLVLVSLPGIMGGITIDSDGQNLYSYSELGNQYSVHSAPKNLETSILHMGVNGMQVTQTSTTQIGKEKVWVLQGAIPGSQQANGKITFYIGAKDNLPRRIVISTTHGAGPQATFHNTQTLVYVSQQINSPIAKSVFKFHPAANATKTDSLGGGGASAFGGLGL